MHNEQCIKHNVKQETKKTGESADTLSPAVF